MAPRKAPTRKKRTSRSKKTGHSTASVLTVGVILAVGATALWASTQNKSPSASVSQLLNPLIAATGFGNEQRSSSQPRTLPQRISNNEQRSQPSSNTTAARTIAPSVAIPRPQVPLNNPQGSKPATTVAALQPTPQLRPESTNGTSRPASAASPAPAPALTSRTVQASAPKTLPENGNSRHANGAYKVPKVIYARQAVQIREKAWDQAKLMGSVEKGREMRSYAKVGRWHRVVVPSTNIIGWVLEDHLLIKDAPRTVATQQNRKRLIEPKRAGAPDPALTTGALKRATPAPKSDQKSATTVKPSYTTPLYPSQPIGKP